MATYFYPQVNQFELIDNSFISCRNGNRLSLADLYFVKYGKTWYEDKLGAKLSNLKKDMVNLIKSGILKDLDKKIKIPLDEFIREYYEEEYFKNKKNLNIIKKIYNPEITLKKYLEYFILNKKDCCFYQNVFRKFIGNPLQGLEWLIDKNIILNYNVNPIII